MVKMENILLVGNLLSMDCYKEGNLNDGFHIVIDVNTFEVISTTLNRPSIYSRQAVAKIRQLFQEGKLPTEATSVWC